MKKTLALGMASLLLFIPQISHAESMENLPSLEDIKDSPLPKLSTSQAPTSNLDFTDITFPDSMGLDSNLRIGFSIYNSSSVGAKNVVIKAISQDLQGLVPKSVSQVNSKYFAPEQKESYLFDFKITNNAQNKNYPIVLYLAYIDESTGKMQESMQTVTVKVENGGQQITGNIGDMIPLPGGNDGNPEASDSSINIPSSPAPSMGDLSGSIPSGGGGSLPITPSGGGGSSTSLGANTPKIMIESYETDPETVQSGVPFTLKLNLFNTNRDKSVRNIRVSLTADAAESVPVSTGNSENPMQSALSGGGGGGASAFTPVGSSNTFHVESIAPRKYASKELTLTTAPDSVAKTYSITANFEYEDKEGNPYTSSEIIGIPVVQKSEIQLGNFTIDTAGAAVGMPIPVSLEFINTGRSNLGNVMVKVRGNFTPDTSTYYAGTIQAGASETYNVNLTPEKSGEQTGEIIITYDDPTGKTQEVIQPFSVNVEEEAPVTEEEMSEDNGSNLPMIIGLSGFFLVIAALAFFLWKKRKNKKNDEEDLKIS